MLEKLKILCEEALCKNMDKTYVALCHVGAQEHEYREHHIPASFNQLRFFMFA
jgi:hypothetical protein